MSSWRIIRRKEPLEWGSLLSCAFAIVLSLIFCGILLTVQGISGFDGILLLLDGGFGSDYSLEDTILKTVPIFLCSLGVAVCFKMQIWNIGAEGQFALGAVGATAFILWFPNAPMVIMLPGMLIGAIVGGSLFAIIPAILRIRFGMNEIISSLMLNYIAKYFVEYLVFGPWMDPNGSGMPETMAFPDPAIVPNLYGRIHWGVIFCIVLAILMVFFFHKTKYGFEISVAGENPRAARYAGIPLNKLLLFVFCLCGALAGIAGAVETSVSVGKMQSTVLAGYGYTAIVVAWLARLRISRIFFFSFLLAGLRVGVEGLQLQGIPAAFGGVIEGCILLTVLAMQFFDTYTIQRISFVKYTGKITEKVQERA